MKTTEIEGDYMSQYTKQDLINAINDYDKRNEVEKILQSGDVDPTAHEIYHYVNESRDLKIIQAFFNDPRVHNCEMACSNSELYDLEQIQFYLDNPEIKENLQEYSEHTFRRYNQIIIENKLKELSDNEALEYFQENKKHYLYENDKTDMYTIKTMYKLGHENIVTQLIKDKHLIASDKNKELFVEAVRNDHVALVRALLKLKNVKVNTRNNQAIQLAKSAEVVEMLLNDERVSYTDENERNYYYEEHMETHNLTPLERAIENSNDELIKAFINSGKAEEVPIKQITQYLNDFGDHKIADLMFGDRLNNLADNIELMSEINNFIENEVGGEGNLVRYFVDNVGIKPFTEEYLKKSLQDIKPYLQDKTFNIDFNDYLEISPLEILYRQNVNDIKNNKDIKENLSWKLEDLFEEAIYHKNKNATKSIIKQMVYYDNDREISQQMANNDFVLDIVVKLHNIEDSENNFIYEGCIQDAALTVLRNNENDKFLKIIKETEFYNKEEIRFILEELIDENQFDSFKEVTSLMQDPKLKEKIYPQLIGNCAYENGDERKLKNNRNRFVKAIFSMKGIKAKSQEYYSQYSDNNFIAIVDKLITQETLNGFLDEPKEDNNSMNNFTIEEVEKAFFEPNEDYILQAINNKDFMVEYEDYFNTKGILNAANTGRLKVFNELVNTHKFPKAIKEFTGEEIDLEKCLEGAIRNNRTEIAKVILTKNISDDFYVDYDEIVLKDNLEMLILLLKDGRVEPDYEVLDQIVEGQYLKNRTKMLDAIQEFSDIDISEDNQFITQVMEEGQIDIVKHLLDNKIVDPFYYEGFMITEAAKHGQIDIMNLFLEDENINKTDWFNDGVKEAFENDEEEMVELLLSNTTIVNSLKEYRPEELKNYLPIINKFKIQSTLANFDDVPELITHSVTKHDKIDEIAITGLIKLGAEPNPELVKQAVQTISVQNKLTDTQTLVEGITLQIPTLETIKQTIVEDIPEVKQELPQSTNKPILVKSKKLKI